MARACGTDLRAFAEEHLFAPLGAELGLWRPDLDGYRIGGGEIHATARDAARFGLLYLDDGVFEGNQVISADWVRDSLQTYSENVDVARPGPFFRDRGYGYQWWSAVSGEYRYYLAMGHGGQLIVLLDDLDMVIVTTADPFYGFDVHRDSWPDERAVINLVGEFIHALPSE